MFHFTRNNDLTTSKILGRSTICFPSASWSVYLNNWDIVNFFSNSQTGAITRSGQLLKDFILYRSDLEDEVPKARLIYFTGIETDSS